MPQPAPDALAGRVILIVGAGGGLGRATALAAAQTGAQLVLLDRRVPELEALHDAIAAQGLGKPALYPLNLERATAQDYADLAARIGAELGRLDGIAFCAARFDGLMPLELVQPALWQAQLQVNLSASWLITQAALPLLRARDDAALVYVLDDPARMRRAHWTGYGVAKCALEGLFAMLAEELHEGPLRVHALLPAPMRTPLRQLAYFGEAHDAQPPPDAAGAALAWLLSAAAAPQRGRILDLRAEAR